MRQKLVFMAFIPSRKQALESLPPDMSTPTGDSVESSTRKDALQAKLPWTESQQKITNSLSHALLVTGPSNMSS
jgi:hypothetical protein